VGRRAMEIKKFIKLKFYELTVYILLLIFLLHWMGGWVMVFNVTFNNISAIL
jgi:hypothetical protein